MSPMFAKATLAIASAMVLSTSFAADNMSKDQQKAAEERIEAQYKASKEKCDALKDNAKVQVTVTLNP